MKKKIFILVTLIITTFSLFIFMNFSKADNSTVIDEDANAVNELISSYYDSELAYTKNTEIFLNSEAIAELDLLGCWHAGSTILKRTTYYRGDSLWMSSENGNYSYYGTAYDGTTPVGVTYASTKNPLRTPAETKVVLSGEGKNSMNEYYVGLEDIVATDTHGWELLNGEYVTTNSEVISWFKAFTAPCYLGFEDDSIASNYIYLTSASVTVENGNLVLRLYARLDDGKFTSEGGLFSEAVISAPYTSPETFDNMIVTEPGKEMHGKYSYYSNSKSVFPIEVSEDNKLVFTSTSKANTGILSIDLGAITNGVTYQIGFDVDMRDGNGSNITNGFAYGLGTKTELYGGDLKAHALLSVNGTFVFEYTASKDIEHLYLLIRTQKNYDLSVATFDNVVIKNVTPEPTELLNVTETFENGTLSGKNYTGEFIDAYNPNTHAVLAIEERNNSKVFVLNRPSTSKSTAYVVLPLTVT